MAEEQTTEWTPTFEKVTRETLPFWTSGYVTGVQEFMEALRVTLSAMGYREDAIADIFNRTPKPSWSRDALKAG